MQNSTVKPLTEEQQRIFNLQEERRDLATKLSAGLYLGSPEQRSIDAARLREVKTQLNQYYLSKLP